MHGSTHAIIPTELISYRINDRKVAFPAVVVGGGCLVFAAILGAIFSGPDFFHAYLGAYLFWFGLTMGCLGLTMLHHLTGGRWGELLRPYLETGTKSLPLMFLLFVPVLLARKLIYPWAHDVPNTAAVTWQAQHWFMTWFVVLRYVIYFAVWIVLAFGLLRQYRLRDEVAPADPSKNSGPSFRVLSAPGIVVMVVTLTLAMIDWAMSVQAGWYSTIYGLLAVASSGLTAFSFMVIVLALVTRQYDASHHGGHGHGPLVAPGDWHDLGNLMFAFTMLWGYMSLSQMLITYSGNLPAETIFYRFRSINGWQYVGGALIVVHFVVPFLLLLMRNVKRDPRKLVLVALFVLCVRQVDFYYQIHPSYTEGLRAADVMRNPDGTYDFSIVRSAFGLHTALHVLAVLGLGGLWVAFFAWNLRDRRVLPAPAVENHHG
ncbi:MAG TPA: hypothetical protein VF796_05130 [Humisphaera sp.]